MMYHFHKNILTIPAKALYDGLNIMSKSNYDKQCRTGKINRVRVGGGYENTALVEFDSIPARFKNQILKKIGFPPKNNSQNLILDYYKDDYEAQDFYANYLLDDYRALSIDVQKEYTINAQMLIALDTYIREMSIFRKSRGGKLALTKIWDDATHASNDVKDQTGHTLPKSVRRLKAKLIDFKSKSYAALISHSYGNQKASKIKDSQQAAILRQLLRDHRNLDNEQIAQIYNKVAKIQNWTVLSSSTIGNYRTKWRLLTYAGNKGEKAFDNSIAMQVKRSKPSFPMIYWTVDGWDAELLFQKTSLGLKGQSVTTFHNRLTIVVVLDPFSNYPIGYSIGSHETPELIQKALRNAIFHTQELFGFKHKVLQIQSDNYAKKKMMPIYEAMSKYFTPARVGNAKGKIIEPWFKYFNKSYCQYASNWSGHGVKSKTQPNDEYLNKIRNNFPNEVECKKQLTKMIETERQKLRIKYIEAYNKMPKDAIKPISQKEYLQHFGETTGFTNRISNNGLTVSINGHKMQYDSFDVNFRKNAELDWIIKYDSNNLSEVLAFNELKNISFLLNEKYTQPMALYDRKDGDVEELAKIRNFNKATKSIIIDSVVEDSYTVKQMFLENPELNDTLAKMLLVDNNGQHKNQRNRSRIEPAQKLMKKSKIKEEKEIKTNWEFGQIEYLENKTDFNKYLQDEHHN